MTKVTSNCGTPRDAGDAHELELAQRAVVAGHLALDRRTWMSTAGWLSAAVENTSLYLCGMVALSGITVVMTA